jgi:hypothetical protein
MGMFTFTTTQRDGNYQMNELADHLAKEAACISEADIAYVKIPRLQ